MNIIHVNLMISFILRCIFHYIFYEVSGANTYRQTKNEMKLINIIVNTDDILITDDVILNHLHEPSYTLCRFAWITYQFSIMTNHFWLLNEGMRMVKYD